MQKTIAARVHFIVFIARTTAGRRVEELIRVVGHEGENYRTLVEE
jgi:Flp pilus assembly CpaF family ATPase